MHLRHRSAQTFKPELQLLDSRCVPSASVSVAGSRMIIDADALGGLVQIRDDGTGNVAVRAAGISQPLARAGGIAHIVVHGGSGNDTIDFRTTGTLRHALDMDLELGTGSDRAYLDLYRGISGVPLNLDVDTGAGNDSLEVHFGSIVNSVVNLHSSLGGGADGATVVMFNGLSGNSRANIDIAGKAGADRIDLNVMGKIDAAAIVNAHVENVADADDRLIVRFNGELDGMLKVRADNAASRYGVQARFALDPASTGTLKAIVTNAAAAFGSTFTVTDHTGGSKVSILDRLENTLTNPAGTKVAKFAPMI